MDAEPTRGAHWQAQVADKRERQKATIPQEWLIPPIPETQTNVLDVPSKCGLLTDRELQITGVSEVSILLNKLATAEWSAVEVTTAFCKRAIVAHQLVCAKIGNLGIYNYHTERLDLRQTV